MVEREQGTGRQSVEEAVPHPAGVEPATDRDAVPPKPRRLEPRPDRGMPFAEALDDSMREHRAVFAALAK